MKTLSDLRDALIVEEALDAPDGGGGFATTWQPIADHPIVFAAIDFGTGDEALSARQLQSRVPCEITLRYRADITPQHRLAEDGYIYEILAIAPDIATGYMVLTCRRRTV